MKKNKILLYIDSMEYGGAQRVLLNLAINFINSGKEVVLVNDYEIPNNKPQYSVPDEIKHIYLRQVVNGNVVLKNIERIKTLRKIIMEEQPETVLSFLGNPNIRMLIATIGIKVRKIVSVRNDPRREYGKSWGARLTANLLFLFADGCVFQTEDAQSYFWEMTKKKSVIILNPVADVFFQTSHSAEPHDIISVGRFEYQKNHFLLMDAFSRIAQEFPEEKLIIYGSGSL